MLVMREGKSDQISNKCPSLHTSLARLPSSHSHRTRARRSGLPAHDPGCRLQVVVLHESIRRLPSTMGPLIVLSTGLLVDLPIVLLHLVELSDAPPGRS
jgi:hypothetical protein